MSHPMDSGGYHVIRAETGVQVSYPGALSSRLVEIAPGVILGHHLVSARELPQMGLGGARCRYLVNHARRGVCEMQTVEGTYIYVKGGDLCVSREWADGGFRYPTGSYEGVELYVFDAWRDDPSGLLRGFCVDMDAVADNYLAPECGTFISHSTDLLEEPLRSIYALFDRGIADASLLRIYGLLILRMLTAALPDIRSVAVSALTPTQLAMAQAAEQTLTNHLDQRIPVREIAAEQGVSETSLKNYFRAVFGQNVSDYLREARMARAKELLRESCLPIGEVARQVGYKNQSRFDAAFQKHVGCTPSEYRRRQQKGGSGS